MIIKPLITPSQLKDLYPATAKQLDFIQNTRQIIRNILNHKDSRKLLIVGPCSIHDTIGALEYATKLKELAVEVKETFFIVMRTYFEKPRTKPGWRGILHDPQLNGNLDLELGLKTVRQLLTQITNLNLPIASEVLDPLVSNYIGDLISWGSIGARTPESQTHRQFVSGLTVPTGFKNSTDGSLLGAIHALKVASAPNSYIGVDQTGHVCSVLTEGNPDVHLVLRGGRTGPNHDAESMDQALALLSQHQLQNRLIVDCSHSNSSKCYINQPMVMEALIHQILAGNDAIKGMMLESYLYAGNQSSPEKYGVSITDECLDWDTTKKMILKQADLLEKEHATDEAKIYAFKG